MAENDPNVKGAEAAEVNDITLTAAQMKDLGIDSVAELQNVLKAAVHSRKDGETIESIAIHMNQAAENMARAASELREKQATMIEEDKFDALSAEKFIEKYKSLGENDPSRAAIREVLEKEYGIRTTALVLDTNEIQKMLQRPVTERNSRFEEIKSVRKANDMAILLTAAKSGIIGGDGDALEVNMRKYRQSLNMLSAEGLDGANVLLKAAGDAMDTLTAGDGAEWVPSYMSADMVQDIYLQLRILSLFPRYYMPSPSYKLPTRPSRGRGYRMAQATAVNQLFTVLATSHTFDTGSVQFDAEKLAVLQVVSSEMEQDSILPVVQMMYEDVVWSLAASKDDACYNGSTSSSDLDNAGSDASRLFFNTTDAGDGYRLNTGTADVRSAWDGIRKSTTSSGKLSFGGVAATLENMRGLRKKMGKYAVTIQDLAYIIGIKTHIDLLNLDQVETLDKYGPNATILQGEIGKIDGIPLVLSEYVYPFLDATGVFNTSSVQDAYTVMSLVNRRGFAYGDRQAVQIESAPQPLSGQRFVIATDRGDFQKIFPAAEPVAALGYNIAV